MEKCLLLFTANTNVLILLYRAAEDRRQKFHFCRLPFAVNVMLNLSNIIWLALRAGKMTQIARCDWLPERAR